jgi:hypothetical protein
MRFVRAAAEVHLDKLVRHSKQRQAQAGAVGMTRQRVMVEFHGFSPVSGSP